MAFTFSENNTLNIFETPDLAIDVNPTTGVIDHVYDAGDVESGVISMENTGLAPAAVYLSADWGPSAGTTDRQATLLANAMTISVFVSSADESVAEEMVYSGRFMDLIDVSIFGGLGAGNTADVAVSVALPGNHAGPTLLNKSIVNDFVFVAVSTS